MRFKGYDFGRFKGYSFDFDYVGDRYRSILVLNFAEHQLRLIPESNAVLVKDEHLDDEEIRISYEEAERWIKVLGIKLSEAVDKEVDYMSNIRSSAYYGVGIDALLKHSTKYIEFLDTAGRFIRYYRIDWDDIMEHFDNETYVSILASIDLGSACSNYLDITKLIGAATSKTVEFDGGGLKIYDDDVSEGWIKYYVFEKGYVPKVTKNGLRIAVPTEGDVEAILPEIAEALFDYGETMYINLDKIPDNADEVIDWIRRAYVQDEELINEIDVPTIGFVIKGVHFTPIPEESELIALENLVETIAGKDTLFNTRRYHKLTRVLDELITLSNLYHDTTDEDEREKIRSYIISESFFNKLINAVR